MTTLPVKTIKSVQADAVIEIRYLDGDREETGMTVKGRVTYVDTTGNIHPIEIGLGPLGELVEKSHGRSRFFIDELGDDANVYLIEAARTEWQKAPNVTIKSYDGKVVVKVAGLWADIETGQEVDVK